MAVICTSSKTTSLIYTVILLIFGNYFLLSFITGDESSDDGLQRQISIVYRDRYRWPRDRYRWPTESDIDGLQTDIDGLERQISMA